MQYAKKSLPSRERGLKSSLLCVGSGHRISSLPSRERGLKYHVNLKHCPVSLVAPLAGAWIEIFCVDPFRMCFRVAPLAGAWIEITGAYKCKIENIVAPLAGAWIEMAIWMLSAETD